MKKLFFISLAAVALLAMAVSCGKDDPNKGKTKPARETVVLDIAIDGTFDDWTGLKGLAVAEVSEDEEAAPCLLKMEAIASTETVYFHFLYQVDEEQTAASFVLDLDADNDPSTGVTLAEYWKDSGFEYELSSSGGFINGENYRKMSDIKLYVANDGFDGKDRWETGAVSDKVAKGVKSAGKRTADLVEIEMSVHRTLIDATKQGELRAGCLVSDPNEEWAVRGWLPSEDGKGMTEMLEVVLP